ncbi:MAG: SET domain-containing protein [Candidatus Doudnabacteria bacterium]|nr:SET domain-containing protein [Candidatus Doudnabacteria bacterium]
MSKVYTKESNIEGKGVFANKNIAKGEIVLAIDDSRKVADDSPLRGELGESKSHCDWFPDGTVIYMQEPERYINHSCDPNSFVKTINGTRYVFALRPIAENEEITYDYCINGFGDTVWQCNCGARRCRKTIHSDFFHLPQEFQLEYLPLLDQYYLDFYKDRVQQLINEQLTS